MSESSTTIAIVGSSGAVGREAIRILESRGCSPASLRLYGSDRSAGTSVNYLNTSLIIECLDDLTTHHHDFVLGCADAETARVVRDRLSLSSSIFIDNSSAFRMDPSVPLVIPEVNGSLLESNPRVIANPNCSTVMMLTAINPLRKAFGVESIVVSTYQAVSGAGLRAVDELFAQTRSILDGDTPTNTVFPCPCAFNVFEHESSIDPLTGFNGEESKLINETRRIWDQPDLSVLPSCVRVPVERAHAQSIVVELAHECTLESIRNLFKQSDGVRLHDTPDPLTPRGISGTDEVHIGRIRIDPSSGSKRVVLWVCCDQLRKGAALNAIQIMDRVIENAASIQCRQEKSTQGSLGACCVDQ